MAVVFDPEESANFFFLRIIKLAKISCWLLGGLPHLPNVPFSFIYEMDSSTTAALQNKSEITWKRHSGLVFLKGRFHDQDWGILHETKLYLLLSGTSQTFKSPCEKKNQLACERG